MIRSVVSGKLLSRLFLTWYNPVTEDDSKLRHILGTFFPLYASMSRANQVCRKFYLQDQLGFKQGFKIYLSNSLLAGKLRFK